MANTSSSSSNGLAKRALKVSRKQEKGCLSCLWEALTRKKPLDGRTGTNLNRCLNLIDLTALGVGSTLGLGLYVLAGQVASKRAGPAVVVSFALAALASAFSALCYAEFAGRVPRAGSAYAYSYITVGEFVAFVIGWNLILEYVIGASSVARGFSSYLRIVYTHTQQLLPPATVTNPSNDTSSLLTAYNLTNITTTTDNNVIIDYLERYFDWPSLVIILVVTIFILLGVKGSTNVTLAFTSLNLLVVVLVVCSSLNQLNSRNWRLNKSEIPEGFGEGGFMPYGFAGILAGSSTCFFGFIGFDTIASSAEEAKEPKRNVPLSILLSLFISFVAYMLVATVQTLLWPYYDQNMDTILPYIFQRLNMPITHWVVLLGAIAGLASSQLGGMYPLPRILYSMANDRLIYRPLAHINSRLKLPVRATIVGSIFVGLLSCLLGLEDLADMVSIGTLAAYTLVSLSVLILRYENRTQRKEQHLDINLDILAINGQQNGNKKIQLENDVKKSKLVPKASTPIHEKGSKPLEPQLSVGFQSWFKSSNDLPAGIVEEQPPKRRKFLNLLEACQLHNLTEEPNDVTSQRSKVLIGVIVVASIVLNLVVKRLIVIDASSSSRLPFISAILFTTLVLILAMIMLNRLPKSREMLNEDMFQVPLVPLVPTLSILVNICLMLNLNIQTWVRFVVWMVVGLFIYFTYGIWNSRGYLMDSNDDDDENER